MTIPPEVQSKIKSLLEGKLTCPADIEGLNQIIDTKNKLTKQLNKLYTGIEEIEKYLKVPKDLISATEKQIPPLKTIIDVTGFLITPAGTPLSPSGPIAKAAKAIQDFEDIIFKNKSIISGGVPQLSLIKEELKKVLTLLDMLDIILELCAREIGAIGGVDGEMLVQTQVSQELISSTQTQSNQLSPVVTNVNGFDMGVETEITGDPLKRRRAIAKNKEGVAVLKGEYSYSSNDQILIDELVFYIQQNDLKAE